MEVCRLSYRFLTCCAGHQGIREAEIPQLRGYSRRIIQLLLVFPVAVKLTVCFVGVDSLKTNYVFESSVVLFSDRIRIESSSSLIRKKPQIVFADGKTGMIQIFAQWDDIFAGCTEQVPDFSKRFTTAFFPVFT